MGKEEDGKGGNKKMKKGKRTCGRLLALLRLSGLWDAALALILLYHVVEIGNIVHHGIVGRGRGRGD